MRATASDYWWLHAGGCAPALAIGRVPICSLCAKTMLHAISSATQAIHKAARILQRASMRMLDDAFGSSSLGGVDWHSIEQ